ncbi:hypothetical protein NQ317_003811 [Molorchus minor]|uniref:Major facilitator superfamily (MFS) profile domain-containing protein n=1 Tax=Molorchus minor TaxID=1323400 RepID=A0ABQ9JG84_9CUCU|nr:hypothetical protein NQ317_003811 [Molorchus minor]
MPVGALALGVVVFNNIGNLATFVGCTGLSWSSPVFEEILDPKQTPFDRDLTLEEISWIPALLPLGATFGTLISAYLAEKIGRKWTLLVCAVPICVSYAVLAFTSYVFGYYIARFVIGLSVGAIFTVIPMYVGEIAEDSNRGALGASINCFITAGILFSYAVGPYIPVDLFNLVLAVLPAIFFILFLILGPESPHYYISKGKSSSARSALEKLRGKGAEKLESELSGMEAQIRGEGHGTFLDIFRSKGCMKAYAMVMGLLVFQQFSGINAILFYAQTIFNQAGSTLEPAICSIILGLVMFLTSFITPFVVELLGRKILLVISASGMLIAEIILGVYLSRRGIDISSTPFLPLACLLVYIVAFNTGFGPLPWAIMGELFPSNVKSAAASSATAVCWFLAFIITKYFEIVAHAIGIGPCFLIFAGFCLLAIPFSIFFLLETKGKSLQEIQNALNS